VSKKKKLPSEVIDEAFGEIEAILEKHGLGGFMVIASKDTGRWESHFPAWSLVGESVRGGMELRRPLHKIDRQKAEETFRFVRELTGIVFDLNQNVVLLDHDLLTVFGKTGLIRIDANDVDEDEDDELSVLHAPEGFEERYNDAAVDHVQEVQQEELQPERHPRTVLRLLQQVPRTDRGVRDRPGHIDPDDDA
jgi:hypothetical protein